MRFLAFLTDRPTSGTVLAICLLILCSPQLFPLPIQAQSACNSANCQPPPQSSISWSHWTQDASITVVVDQNFTQQERDAIMTGINNWEAANGSDGNHSGVTFNFVISPITGTPSSGQLQVRKQTPPNAPTDQGRMLAAPTSNNLAIDNAIMFLNPAITNTTALSHAAAHKTGHTFGLGECNTCPSGTSVMTLARQGMNDTTFGCDGPSSEPIN